MSASPPLNSVVITVMVGTKTLVSTRLIAVSATMTFAELLGFAIAGESESERATLATLPVTVAAYTSSLHLSNQRAGAAQCLQKSEASCSAVTNQKLTGQGCRKLFTPT